MRYNERLRFNIPSDTQLLISHFRENFNRLQSPTDSVKERNDKMVCWHKDHCTEITDPDPL